MPIEMKTKKKTVAKKKASVTTKKKTAAKKKASVTAKKKTAAKKKASVATKKKRTLRKKTGKAAIQKKAAPAMKKKTAVGKKANVKQTAKKAVRRKIVKKKPLPYQREKNEEYMNSAQLEHFRQILLDWKRELIEGVEQTVMHMKEEASNFADPADRATQEEEFGLELRTRDRERKLLKKINAALLRIEDGSYGYCEETGEEIGIRRLEARPVATLCLEAQQRREMAKKQFRDLEDHDR